MSKHTEGPWKVEKELFSSKDEWLIAKDCGDRGRGIAIARTLGFTNRELSNAQLMAAAPDLLGVLEDLMSMRNKCFIPNENNWWDEKAEAAIAKVRGEIE